ncbi:hypothetical protein B0T24DRAFT_683625 [Lasiosphaeria ovina]|uniref:Uncharacterized protein n=1 Tax=Lasiosphaeria ovina TaxID=92902 RepID=A0AAE0N0I0_9PEZI|nr:hypothetical protein B0T24DRAFT_683625 [Lasiosphaeria ovina]
MPYDADIDTTPSFDLASPSNSSSSESTKTVKPGREAKKKISAFLPRPPQVVLERCHIQIQLLSQLVNSRAGTHLLYMDANHLDSLQVQGLCLVHIHNMAATALFLANKTEENCRKTKDLIIAVAKVARKNTKLIIDHDDEEEARLELL